MEMTMKPMKLKWTPAKVGCHWSAGDFSASTYSMGGPFPQPFPQSGYSLFRERREIGRYPTLKEAQLAAEVANETNAANADFKDVA
jgi:hypothetical protein